MEYYNQISSPVGTLTVASEGEKITGLWIEGQKYFASTLDPKAVERDLPIFQDVRNWLDQYFAAENPSWRLPLAPKGSSFRQDVWKILCEIPYGEVVTYGQIAKRISQHTGQAMSAQPVGGAVGHNPISILIPCHRVVGSNRSLTGYAGGIDKKIQLLALENVRLEQFVVPKKGTAI